MMSSIHQKKTDSTDKIAVFYAEDGAGSKGLSVSYFEEYAKMSTVIIFQDPFSMVSKCWQFVFFPLMGKNDIL